jgi:3-dehydro-4-phosphotetronate decarboxylase
VPPVVESAAWELKIVGEVKTPLTLNFDQLRRLFRAVRRREAMSEASEREVICAIGASIFARGLTAGSSGNISLRTDEGWLMTSTGSSLGRLSKLDRDGRLVSGDPPTKESFLHHVMYEEYPATGAVVHLHSTHSVAVSCLAEIDPARDAGRPIAARPLFPPRRSHIGGAVRNFAGKHHAVLLAVTAPSSPAPTLDAAVNAIEELESTARLYLLLRGVKTRYLTAVQVREL